MLTMTKHFANVRQERTEYEMGRLLLDGLEVG